MRYDGMPPGSGMAAMGTGWLISPDTLVTAGHVVYDHSGNDGRGYGKLQSMQWYIGYSGRDSLEVGLADGSVQSRLATQVTTTGEWVDSRDYPTVMSLHSIRSSIYWRSPAPLVCLHANEW